MKRMSRVVLAAVAAAGVAFVAPAEAVTWYSSGSPLTAYESNKAVAQSYGNFHNSGGSYAKNSVTYRAVGSNDAYVRTSISLWDRCAGSCPKGTWDWVFRGAESTATTRSSKWVDGSVQRTLTGSGTKARAEIRTAAARPWHTANPHSVYAYVTFNY